MATNARLHDEPQGTVGTAASACVVLAASPMQLKQAVGAGAVGHVAYPATRITANEPALGHLGVPSG